MKSTALENIINGNDSDKFLRDLKAIVFINGNLDMIKLYKEIEKWNEVSNDVNKAKIEYFMDPLTKF